MPKHIWSVLCSHSMIDKETNNVQLNVIEQLELGIQGNKELNVDFAVPANLQVVTLWEKEENDDQVFTALVEVDSPNHQKLMEGKLDFSFTKYERFRTRIGFQGLKVPEEGKFIFNVYLLVPEKKKKLVASVPLLVKIQRT